MFQKLIITSVMMILLPLLAFVATLRLSPIVSPSLSYDAVLALSGIVSTAVVLMLMIGTNTNCAESYAIRSALISK